MTTTLTLPNLFKFLTLYRDAHRANEPTFIFNGHVVLTQYAYHLLKAKGLITEESSP